MRFRTSSRTLARPLACMLSFSASMMLMTSFGALQEALANAFSVFAG
jgi:hypothetical protein